MFTSWLRVIQADRIGDPLFESPEGPEAQAQAKGPSSHPTAMSSTTHDEIVLLPSVPATNVPCLIIFHEILAHDITRFSCHCYGS